MWQSCMYLSSRITHDAFFAQMCCERRPLHLFPKVFPGSVLVKHKFLTSHRCATSKCSHSYLMKPSQLIAKALFPREPIPNGLHGPAWKLLAWQVCFCLESSQSALSKQTHVFHHGSQCGQFAPSVAMLLRVSLRMMLSITLSKFRVEGLDANMATSSVLRSIEKWRGVPWVKPR